MDTKYNHQKSMLMVEQKLKDLGINKSLDKMYKIYASEEKCKDFIILSNYLKSVGSINNNPYNLYNHYFYYDGLNQEGQLI